MEKDLRQLVKKVNKEYIRLKDKNNEYTREIGTKVWCANEAVKEFEAKKRKTHE